MSIKAGLDYIVEHGLPFFQVVKQCKCCGGGKTAKEMCWRCAGFEKKPSLVQLKEHHVTLTIDWGEWQKIEKPKKADYERAVLHPCTSCGGIGKTTTYEFNPFSEKQLKALLYDELHTPKSVWHGKVTADETALKRVLQWSQGGKRG